MVLHILGRFAQRQAVLRHDLAYHIGARRHVRRLLALDDRLLGSGRRIWRIHPPRRMLRHPSAPIIVRRRRIARRRLVALRLVRVPRTAGRNQPRRNGRSALTLLALLGRRGDLWRLVRRLWRRIRISRRITRHARRRWTGGWTCARRGCGHRRAAVVARAVLGIRHVES